MTKRILAAVVAAVVIFSVLAAGITGFVANASAENAEVTADNQNGGKTVSGKITVTDDCIDFSNCVAHSDGLFAYTVPEEDYYAFDSDYTMFRRSTNTNQWLVYKINNISSPVFYTYFKYTDNVPHFSFEVSKDGENWKKAKADIKSTAVEDWKWIPVTYTLNNLDKDVRFVKIIYSADTEYEWTPMISSVGFKYDYTGAGFADCKGTKYQNSTAALNALNLIDGVNENEYKPYEDLTRAELSKLVADILAMKKYDVQETYFKDVKSDHWAAWAINALYKLGVVNGDENGNFNPESNISYIDTAKILISVLGYGAEAESKGGYPEGYRVTAKRLKLFDDISISDDTDKVNRGDGAIILNNALDTPIIHNTVYGDNPEFKKDGETIFSVYHNIKSVSGVVTAADGLSTVSGVLCSENEVIIDGTVYKCRSEKLTPDGKADSLLGRYINGYTDFENNLLYAEAKNSDILELTADNYVTISSADNKVYYEDGKGKEKSVNLSPNTRIVYNGRYKTRVGVLKNTDFDESVCESFDVITNGGGSADCILIWDYKNYVAASGGNLKRGITSKNDGVFKPDFDNADKVQIKLYGEYIDITDTNIKDITVEKNDVISAAISEDGGIINIYCDKRTVTGVAEALKNGDKRYVKINGDEYNLSSDYQTYGNSIEVGKEVTVYLDMNGKVFLSENTGGFEYAYLCAVGGTDVFGSELMLKLLTSDGTVKDYKADDKTVLNGTKNKVSSIASLQPEAVRVVLKDNYISQIETAKESLGETGDDEFTLCLSSKSCKYYSGSLCVFASTYQLSKSTPVFVIPKDKKDYDKYRVYDRYGLFSDYEYNVRLYDLSDEYTVGAAVVYAEGSRERTVQSYDNIAIIKSCSVINNAKGEACLKLDVYQNGEETAVYFDNDGGTDMTNDWLKNYIARNTQNGNIVFKGGEVIQQYSDSEAHCKSFRMFLTEDMIKNKKVYENNIGDYGRLDKNNYFSELYTAYGKVEKRFADKIILCPGEDVLRTVSLNNARVYKYNNRKMTVDNADVSDIVSGDYVFVKMSYGDTTDIMVVSEN